MSVHRMLLLFFTEFMHLNTMSGVELGNNEVEVENEDSDSVELGKSNVLLRGPEHSPRGMIEKFTQH